MCLPNGNDVYCEQIKHEDDRSASLINAKHSVPSLQGKFMSYRCNENARIISEHDSIQQYVVRN